MTERANGLEPKTGWRKLRGPATGDDQAAAHQEADYGDEGQDVGIGLLVFDGCDGADPGHFFLVVEWNDDNVDNH
jgi:hypothetical protein